MSELCKYNRLSTESKVFALKQVEQVVKENLFSSGIFKDMDIIDNIALTRHFLDEGIDKLLYESMFNGDGTIANRTKKDDHSKIFEKHIQGSSILNELEKIIEKNKNNY